TQLIARAVREANVFCEIIPFHKPIPEDPAIKGIILSGSPFSVNDANAPDIKVKDISEKFPVLGVCYGAQLTAKQYGGVVSKSNKREYGRAMMHKKAEDDIFKGISNVSQVWMSHSDSVLELPSGFSVMAETESIPY